jgi:hypothetical protein
MCIKKKKERRMETKEHGIKKSHLKSKVANETIKA